jgi:hypothetical protein
MRRTGEVLRATRRTGHALLALALAPLLLAAAPQPDGARGAWRGWERDLVLQVEVDRRQPFVGEQVTATVWLLSPVGVLAYEAFRPPAHDGFWVEEIETPERVSFEIRTVNGIPMRAYMLQRIALFPMRAGPAEIGPFQLEVAVRLGSDPFLGALAEIRRARRSSAPVPLRVQPLPPGAPAGFHPANVGTFTIDAAVSDTQVPVGEPVTVRVIASGEGNFRALSLPRLPLIPGARAFEPTLVERRAPGRRRLAGSRTLEAVLVPERPGELVVPPLEWPFFDPRSRSYGIGRTPELRVTILPGAGADPVAAASSEDSLAAGLRPLRGDGELAPRSPPPWRRAPFLAIVVLPPLAFGADAMRAAFRRRALADAPLRRARGAGRRAQRRLRRARRMLDAGDREGALLEVERALTGFASDRLGRPVSGMTRAPLLAALAQTGARPGAIAALSVALETCDAARFGGGAARAEEVLAQAERALALALPFDAIAPPEPAR